MGICGLGGMFWETPLPPREVCHYEHQPNFGDLTRYDVFLNHRGPDVKRTFVSQLDDALRHAGQDPFLDAKALVKGQHAFRSINEALTGVHVHVAVFSPGYAESKYCLNELYDMLESHKPIIPVFYNVEPENLRCTNRGPFAKAFRKHKKKGRDQDVVRWKSALLEAAAVTGFRRIDYDNDTLLVDEVKRTVLTALPAPPPMASARYLVGLEDSSMHVIEMLHDMGDNVGVMGICGMGGIGKTTLAKDVYNREQSNFESRCFLNDVKEAKGVAVMDLQVQMVMDLLHVDVQKTHWNFSRWFEKIRKQKVLIVVDDINERKQLDELIPELKGLAPGSRVLITSRESNVLKNIMMDVTQSKLYPVPELNLSDSMDLFVSCAFRKNSIAAAEASFCDFVREIAKACDGLPLALEVMGGFLADKRNMPEDKKYWEDAICALRKNGEIISKLQLSYDGLASDEDKRMFRDIAGFLLGHPKEVAMEVWESSGDYGGAASWSLSRLMDKNLVKVDHFKRLVMHDLLRDMGRNVIIENARQSGKIQSHIWDASKAAAILQKNKIWNEILALTVVGTVPSPTCEAELYAYMIGLRYLVLDGCPVNGDFSGWSQELKWMQWRYFPHEELPSSLKLPNLAVLDLNDSRSLTRIWAKDFEAPCKELRMLSLRRCSNLEELPWHINKPVKLKFLKLAHCSSLRSLPESLADLTALEYLDLSTCISLTSLPELSSLRRLKQLNLSGCKTLPKSFSNLSTLEILDISKCTLLHRLSPSIIGLTELRVLRMSDTPLEELPENIGHLQRLTEVGLSGCARLRALPESFADLSNLETLDLSACSVFRNLSPSIVGLKKLRVLRMSGTSLEELPENIGHLQRLTNVDLCRCARLRTLPESFADLSNLETLNLSACSVFRNLPPSIVGLKKLRVLRISGTPLEELPENIGHLQRLTEVGLSGCARLRTLPESFADLSNLETLDLSACSVFRNLPPSIVGLKKLRVLRMSGTPLEELPENIGHLQRLTEVGLWRCARLRTLPESFADLSNLETLDLSFCSVFRNLPPSIVGLKKLRVLRMSGTPLEELPENIGHLQRLTEVDLSGCARLRTLPESFADLSNLETLDLSACSVFRNLPPSIIGLKKLRVLRMSGTPLEELPENIGHLQRLTNVDLCRCARLRTLPESFTDLSNLETLNLSACSVFRNLSPSIVGLKKLRVLRMSGTPLEELPENVGHLQRLTEVGLSGCARLRTLPESFADLSNLETLDLSACSVFRNLPPSIVGLKKLRVLRMSGTPLEELPENVGHLQRLTEVGLSGCARLRTLSESFADLSNLETLNLSACSVFRNLPPSIVGLKKLRVLRMSGTPLEELPENIGHLQRLTEVGLSGCARLRTLPESFADLSNLETLDLSACSVFRNLPPSIVGLKKLRVLRMSGTPLEELPENVGHLQRLTEVGLSGCARLRTLSESFADLSNLETLNLSACSVFRNLPPSIIGLKKLRVLRMSGTPLEELPENIGHLQRLTEVGLSGCARLRTLPESFADLSNLETLDLSACSVFRNLPPSIVGLKKLRVLRMSGTPLEELPENIGHLQRLTEVGLSGCARLRTLPESFSDLSSVQRLDLLECGMLRKLPTSMGGLKMLKMLRITSTLLEVLSEDFGGLQSLIEADLSWCKKLTMLPDSFWKLGNLEELNLFECELLEKLPPFFCKLKKLRVLRMTSTVLEDLPEDFGLLQSLELVDLSHCVRLTTLPDSFSNLFNLEELSLFGCKLLHKFPTSVCQFRKMRVLQMRRTALEELPEDFGQLQSLSYADISHCASLTKLPNSFSDLTSLEYLNLSNCNLLQKLPPFIGRVKRLRVLRMGRTALKELPEDFGQLESLTDANFQGCKQLHSLGESVGCLGKLRKLSLRGCSTLIELPESFLKLSNLESLDVRGCPLLQMDPLPMGQLRLRSG